MGLKEATLFRDYSKLSLMGVCCVSAALFLMIRLNTPIVLLADARGDDALFIRLGETLARGDYLGSFTSDTLCKGPGYSLFLAASHFTGLSITLAQALLFLLSIAAFSFVVSKSFGSAFVGAAVFVLTILHPTMLVGRIIREAIYTSQLFLILAGLLATFVVYRQRSILFGAATGLATSWFWITREEGLWITPGIGVFVAILLLLDKSRADRRRQTALGLAVYLLASVVGFLAFCTANWLFYGSFVGVDMKERNFTAAYKAVQSVRDGKQISFVPVSASTREKIYAVSPTFASLKDNLDPPNGRGPGPGCRYYPQTCGDMAAGWFIWEFRGAAAAKGAYKSPADASAFFSKMAADVQSACADGRLHCSAGLLPFLPHLSAEQIALIPTTSWGTIRFVVNVLQQATTGGRSTGTRAEIDNALRFLNYPSIQPTLHDRTIVELSGWLRRKGDAQPLISVVNNKNLPVPQLLEPLAFVAAAYGRKEETDGRRKFVLTASCDASCSVSVVGGINEHPVNISVQTLLQDGRSWSAPEWDGFVQARIRPPISEPGEATAAHLRSLLSAFYSVAFPVMLPLGFLAAIAAAVLNWNRSGPMLFVGLAASLWILFLSRLGLIILIEISSFPAINNRYLNVAMYLSIPAVILSLSSFIIALRPGISGMADTPVGAGVAP